MASSQKRIAANRENARRSTGPKTGTGKDRARRNGITHGLTTTAMLLDDEDSKQYEALVAATIQDLEPRSERETALAIHVANTMWRRERLYRAEAAFINVRARSLKAEHPEIRNSAEATAMLLTEPADAARVRLLLRYITTAERACNRAVADFFEVRNERSNAELLEAEAAAAASGEAALAAGGASDEAQDSEDEPLLSDDIVEAWYAASLRHQQNRALRASLLPNRPCEADPPGEPSGIAEDDQDLDSPEDEE